MKILKKEFYPAYHKNESIPILHLVKSKITDLDEITFGYIYLRCGSFDPKFLGDSSMPFTKIKKYIKDQEKFIQTLTISEVYTLAVYTGSGFFIINHPSKTFFKNYIEQIKELYEYYTQDTDDTSNFMMFPLFFQFIELINTLEPKNILKTKSMSKKPILQKIKTAKLNSKKYKLVCSLLFDFSKSFVDKARIIYLRDICLIFEKAPRNHQLNVYRGLVETPVSSKQKSLVSTTFKLGIALDFQRNNDCCLMEINIPQGVPTIFMDLVSFMGSHQYEVLLFNPKFQISKKIHKDSKINGYKSTYDVFPTKTFEQINLI